jgi:mannose/cellobiose epimerase-like protein (N-acyl-D-glucosamine 2-epimerase family)
MARQARQTKMSSETHIQSCNQAGCTASPEASLRNRVCDHLKRQVLDRWYPACIDETIGGFHQNFGRDWSRKPSTTRSLVFQSRMTWVAAEAAGTFPGERERYLAIARHGLCGMRQHLADPEAGGFFFATDPPGVPRTGSEVKHAYGMAFAIYAASAVSQAGASDDAKDVAVDAFRWLNDHAWDNTNGGCHEALQRSGEPVLIDDAAPGEARPTDSICTPIGYKSMNTHIHLLEAFTALFRVWPDLMLRARIVELQALITDQMWVDPGSLHTVFTPDWKPVTGGDSFGHNVETGYLLVESMHVLGFADDEAMWCRSRALVDHALARGWDKEHGGFYDTGDGIGGVADDTKTWWVQAEGLNALCLMHNRFRHETDRYLKIMLDLWSFIEGHQVDPEHGGWYGYLTRDGGRVLDGGVKANEWKTAYHNARALMNVIKLLGPRAAREVQRPKE